MSAPLGTVAEGTPDSAIQFAKQSFRHPGVEKLIAESPELQAIYKDVLNGFVKNVKTKPGGFLATSGVVLPYYLNLSTNFMDLSVSPKLVKLIAAVLKMMHAELGCKEGEKVAIVGMEVAGGMVVAQLAAKDDPELNKLYDFVYMRKNRKTSGTAQQLEATQAYTSRTPESPAMKTLWIDDVNSTGSSLCDGIKILQEDYNMIVTTALYVVDRSVDRANLELSRQKLSHPHFVEGKTVIRAVMDLSEIDPLVPRDHMKEGAQ